MIYINDIPSFRDPEKEILTIDDRQERIEIIGDVAIQDMGRIENGDVFSLQCMFTTEKYLLLEALWLARTKVTYTDTGGQVWQNMRLVFKKIERNKNFPDYVMVTFDLWRK